MSPSNPKRDREISSSSLHHSFSFFTSKMKIFVLISILWCSDVTVFGAAIRSRRTKGDDQVHRDLQISSVNRKTQPPLSKDNFKLRKESYTGISIPLSTPSPTPSPTPEPTLEPTLKPTPGPTVATPQPTLEPTIATPQPTSSPTCSRPADLSDYFEKGKFVSENGGQDLTYTIKCDDKLDIIAMRTDPTSCNPDCLGLVESTVHKDLCKEEKEITVSLSGDFTLEPIYLGSRDKDVDCIMSASNGLEFVTKAPTSSPSETPSKQPTQAPTCTAIDYTNYFEKGEYVSKPGGQDVSYTVKCDEKLDIVALKADPVTCEVECLGVLVSSVHGETCKKDKEVTFGLEGDYRLENILLGSRDKDVNLNCGSVMRLGGVPTAAPTLAPIKLIDLKRVGNDGDDVFPLGECEGDCDSDSDCDKGLTCFQRNGIQSIPGCKGDGVSGTDYCYDRSKIPPPTPFPTFAPNAAVVGRMKVRLYWENGYTWQESRQERWWCMECTKCSRYSLGDGDFCSSPGSSSSSCREGHSIWIRDCRDNSKNFRFNVVKNNGSGDLVRADGTNLCLSTVDNTYLEMRNCNPNDGKQLWVPIKSLSQFELRPYHQRNWSRNNAKCVSQLHHPKSKELVGLHRCSTAHGDETGFWEEF